MKITVEKGVYKALHPQLQIAFIFANGIDNKSKLKESQHLLQEAEDLIRLTFNKDAVKTHHLISPWAILQKGFGGKAHHYHTSVERLLKQVIARKSITSDTVLTNLVRYISLKHIIPLGVDDLSEVKGEIVFTIADKKRRRGIIRTLQRNELYYHDDKGILGTKLDYWKSTRTMPTAKSIYALVHIEALPPITPRKLSEVVAEMERLLKAFCGANTTMIILNKKRSTATV